MASLSLSAVSSAMDIDNFENFWLPENPSLQRQLFWEHFDPSRSLFLAFGGIWLDEIRREGDLPLLNVPGGSVPYGEKEQHSATTYIISSE